MSTPWQRKEIIGNCTLYLGDCMAVMAALDGFDHCITDPPYTEVTMKNARSHKNRGFGDLDSAAFIPFSITDEGIDAVFERIGEKVRRWVVATVDFKHASRLFGAPPASLRFVRLGAWVKQNCAPQFTGDRPAQGFETVTILHKVGEKLRWNGGGQRAVWVTDVERNNGHPTPKPLQLISKWLAQFTDEGETVCDPFMGSGTTGVACVKAGRHFIGMEIDPTYFDLACARIREANNQPDMFIGAGS